MRDVGVSLQNVVTVRRRQANFRQSPDRGPTGPLLLFWGLITAPSTFGLFHDLTYAPLGSQVHFTSATANLVI